MAIWECAVIGEKGSGDISSLQFNVDIDRPSLLIFGLPFPQKEIETNFSIGENPVFPQKWIQNLEQHVMMIKHYQWCVPSPHHNYNHFVITWGIFVTSLSDDSSKWTYQVLIIKLKFEFQFSGNLAAYDEIYRIN